MKYYKVSEKQLLALYEKFFVLQEYFDDNYPYTPYYMELAKKDLQAAIEFGEIQEVE
jgi:hypothetical protein